MTEKPAFEMLHEGVRHQLWKLGWPALRQLQVDAIRQILTTDGDVVLSAGTASGKTEAAFLPVLSAIADEPEGSVRAIYVGPLKALINDQFMRVEELCGYLDMPVHRWHGDVAATAKAKLVANPGGVLLITPESLESLFVNRSNSLRKLLHGLRFVVIDELHSFLDNERGRHLRSLLYRVAALTEKPLRLIGLSATIGDPAVAKTYLARDYPERVHWINGVAAEAELKLRLHAYVATSEAEILAASRASADNEPPKNARNMADDLVSHCRGHTNLVFANARNDVEYYGELCARLAAAQSLPDRFLVHHGSLSADLRQDAEELMKESSKKQLPATTFCSSTLEMGIDIGNVRMVGQIGAPYSVASLKQRVGRSGRRDGTPRILRTYLQCRRVDGESSLFDRLHLHLIQSIAVTQLLLEGWVEPAESSSFDLSTLTQQIISLIAESGGVPAKAAYGTLCERGYFRDVSTTTFAALLRQLASKDVIEQTGKGDLILGLAGEDLRKDRGFYAAFMSSDALAVVHDGQRIGSVDGVPEVGEHMVLAGRRWRVTDVDDRLQVVYVVPALGSKAAPFGGDGSAVLHPRVVMEMRSVLKSTANIAYLDPTAAQLLNDARQTATAVELCAKRLIALDAKHTAVMTWTGSRAADTLRAMFNLHGIETSDAKIAIVASLPMDSCRSALHAVRCSQHEERRLLAALSGPPMAKYDALLTPELIQEIRKHRWLDSETANSALSACSIGS